MYFNNLAIGRYLTTKDVRIFKELVAHVAVSTLSDVLGRKNHISDVYIASGIRFALDREQKWYVLGAIEVPVSGPQPYDWLSSFALLRKMTGAVDPLPAPLPAGKEQDGQGDELPRASGLSRHRAGSCPLSQGPLAASRPPREDQGQPGQALGGRHAGTRRKLAAIEATGVLAVDLSWLNANYQRALFHYVRKSTADRLREVAWPCRLAALVCFLRQSYRDAVDSAVDMFDKLLTRTQTRAGETVCPAAPAASAPVSFPAGGPIP